MVSGLLAMVVFGAYLLLFAVVSEMRHSVKGTDSPQAALASVERIEDIISDLETGVIGFAITHDPAALRPWNTERDDLRAAETRLERLAASTGQRRSGEARRIVEDSETYLRRYLRPARRRPPAKRGFLAGAGDDRRDGAPDHRAAVRDRPVRVRRARARRARRGPHRRVHAPRQDHHDRRRLVGGADDPLLLRLPRPHGPAPGPPHLPHGRRHRLGRSRRTRARDVTRRTGRARTLGQRDGGSAEGRAEEPRPGRGGTGGAPPDRHADRLRQRARAGVQRDRRRAGPSPAGRLRGRQPLRAGAGGDGGRPLDRARRARHHAAARRPRPARSTAKRGRADHADRAARADDHARRQRREGRRAGHAPMASTMSWGRRS